MGEKSIALDTCNIKSSSGFQFPGSFWHASFLSCPIPGILTFLVLIICPPFFSPVSHYCHCLCVYKSMSLPFSWSWMSCDVFGYSVSLLHVSLRFDICWYFWCLLVVSDIPHIFILWLLLVFIYLFLGLCVLSRPVVVVSSVFWCLLFYLVSSGFSFIVYILLPIFEALKGSSIIEREVLQDSGKTCYDLCFGFI